ALITDHTRGRTGQHDVLGEGDECVEIAALYVRAILSLAQSVLGAPDDDLELVLDPHAQEGVDAQRARDAVDEREHVRGEVLLQRGVLVRFGEHDRGQHIAAQDDDETLRAPPRALIAPTRAPSHPTALDTRS